MTALNTGTLSVRQAAERLDVRVNEIYRLLRTGRLDGAKKIRVGGFSRSTTEWVIPRASIEAWAASGNGKKRRGMRGNNG